MNGPMGLPFREVWVFDTEYISRPGERPIPVCMGALEIGTGHYVELWADDGGRPPFDMDTGVLFVAFMAAAELGYMIELGWPTPRRVLDLFVEFRRETNGQAVAEGTGLLGALRRYRLPGITKEEKDAGRNLVLRGGPWTSAERRDILDYCRTDVDATAALLGRMLPAITMTPAGLGQALLRGRYMTAVAWMERTGIPIDVPAWESIRENLDVIRGDLIAEVDPAFGVYDGLTFREGLFNSMLVRRGIPWPRTAKGHLKLEEVTFRDMALAHPELEPLRQLRVTCSELRPERLAVGADGRNRVGLRPFGTVTGRNNPPLSQFIFGQPAWMRGLIRPAEGNALAYVDYASQEVTIAAALSGDQALLDAVATGDPYMAFAVRAGMAPAGATKDTHPDVRAACKGCVLGVNYGMRQHGLRFRVGCTLDRAVELLQALARTFPVFWEWSEQVVNVGAFTKQLSTVYGWTTHPDPDVKATALRNYPMQATGSEVLRIACCQVTETGIAVCAPVHDALLIEAPEDDLDDAVEVTRILMTDAASVVLGGIEIGTDAKVIRWPGRYHDDRGGDMWDRVERLLSRVPEYAHSRFEDF